MISVEKGPVPRLLMRKGAVWQQQWSAMVAHYGDQDQVPRHLLQPLKHYRAQDLVAALFAESRGKCVYCECMPDREAYDVEHFLPKPEYPEAVFRWSNLMAVCRPCNAAKADFDTGRLPLIDPTRQDPTPYFSFDGPDMLVAPQAPDYYLAERTLEVLDLNRPALLDARARALAAHDGSLPGPEHAFSACLRHAAGGSGG